MVGVQDDIKGCTGIFMHGVKALEYIGMVSWEAH